MTPTLTDLDYMARTVWAEARGESYRGRRAVANVILNRARRPGWWGRTIKDVCLTSWQFSGWNTGDPNRNKLGEPELDDAVFRSCVMACLDALGLDETDGADHYYTGPEPDWAKGREPSFVLGNHRFFNDVE